MRSPPRPASAQAILHPAPRVVVIGHSAGAWGALALAGEDPKNVAAIIAFAPGRGGRHATDGPGLRAAYADGRGGEFGKAAREGDLAGGRQ